MAMSTAGPKKTSKNKIPVFFKLFFILIDLWVNEDLINEGKDI